MATYWGMNPPFIGGAQRVLSRQEDLRLVKNDLLQLLLTVPGERVHRPNFGSPIRESLFDPSDDEQYDLLADGITEAILAQEPRILNPAVTVEPNHDGSLVNVHVIGRLSFDPNVVIEVTQDVTVPGV